jgi:hypothetical protein
VRRAATEQLGALRRVVQALVKDPRALDAERPHLNPRPGSRFDKLIREVLKEFDDDKIPTTARVRTSRSRLARADEVLSGMKAETVKLQDPDVRKEIERLDRAREQTLLAFNRLVGAVEHGTQGDVDNAIATVNLRLTSSQKAGQWLLELMRPYYTDDERSQIEDLTEDLRRG